MRLGYGLNRACVQAEAAKGSLPEDAPRIRHYIAALAASNAHQKMVGKGDDGVGEGGKRVRKAEVKEMNREMNLANQRRERAKTKNKQAVVDIMMLLDTNHLSDIRHEFMEAEDGLRLNAFVRVMLKYREFTVWRAFLKPVLSFPSLPPCLLPDLASPRRAPPTTCHPPLLLHLKPSTPRDVAPA